MPTGEGTDSPLRSLRALLGGMRCRVLIVGSLPPGGRDYDLLVLPPCRSSVIDALEADGFESFRGQWVRLSPGHIEVVDLKTTDDWGLPEDAANEAFARSQPVEGLEPLWAPSPSHQLVVLARRLNRGGDGLSRKHFDRIESALEAHPVAWDEASELAHEWGVETGLLRLRRRFEHRSVSRAPRRLPIRGRGPGVAVALSGLDGSGKSTQARLLHHALSGLGRNVEVVWSPIGQGSGLARLALTTKQWMARLPFGPLAHADQATVAQPLFKAAHEPAVDPRPMRQASVWLWWVVMSVADAVTRWRVVLRCRLTGRILILDRYILDTVVDLRVSTGRFAGRELIEHLVRAISPRPGITLFLAVPPDVAHARKPDWGLTATRARAAVYDSEYRRVGAILVDATGSLEQTAAHIAREVLSAIW